MNLEDFAKQHDLIPSPDGNGLMVPDRSQPQPASKPKTNRKPRGQDPVVTAEAQSVSEGHVRVTLPLPPKGCSPNARPGVRGAMSAKKKARTLAWAVMLPLEERSVGWTRIRADVTWYHRTKNHRDRDNIIASLKSTIDGFEDSGLIANDRGVEWGDITPDTDGNRPRVIINLHRIT